jgi:hypothetical protein
MAITAGRGIDGAGETDRLDEKDDLRLWLMTLGGFISSAMDVGVPGADGAGEPITTLGTASIEDNAERYPSSGGAGLWEDIRRGGKSALLCMATFGGASLWLLRVYCPSFVLKE